MNQSETTSSSLDATPLDDAFQALTPHFVSLMLDPELEMALVLTLACASEWVCYATPQVRIMPPHYVAGGVLLRLVAIAEAPVDALLAHGTALVTRNRQIEERRQEIHRLQVEAEQKLRGEIAQLMSETGGFELAPPAPALPAVTPQQAPALPQPAAVAPTPLSPRPDQGTYLSGRPDVQVYVHELADVDPTPGSGRHPEGPAPSLAQLAQGI
jgi:hypothetical protein